MNIWYNRHHGMYLFNGLVTPLVLRLANNWKSWCQEVAGRGGWHILLMSDGVLYGHYCSSFAREKPLQGLAKVTSGVSTDLYVSNIMTEPFGDLSSVVSCGYRWKHFQPSNQTVKKVDSTQGRQWCLSFCWHHSTSLKLVPPTGNLEHWQMGYISVPVSASKQILDIVWSGENE